MTADPSAHLVGTYGCKEVFRIHHNRSDQFVNYFVDRSEVPFEGTWLRDFLKPRPELADTAEAFLNNQYRPYIGYENTLKHKVTADSDFVKMLETETVDIIMLDNFMDVTSKILRLKSGESPERKVFFPLHFYENIAEIEEKFEFTDYLTPEESARNWIKIYKFFRQLQPKAKIYMVCWSNATSRANPERTDRILGFYDHVYDMAQGMDLNIIPPLDVPDELTNGPDDWYHMASKMYQAVAGYVFTHAAGNLPPRGKMTSWSPAAAPLSV